MDLTTQIVLLVFLLIIGAILIIFRKNPLVKKYWKYALILLPGIIILILNIIASIKGSKTNSATNQTPVQDQIDNIQGKLQEANTVAKIEASVATDQNDEKMKQLQQIQQITDDQERRKQLAAMLG